MNVLLDTIRGLILSVRKAIVYSVDTIQVITNFEIGRHIVDNEQRGAERAGYGEETLKELAASLAVEFGRGFSLTNLKHMRQFYLAYRQQIGQTLSDNLTLLQKGQTLSDQLQEDKASSAPFTLSWSHYVFLMGIKDLGNGAFMKSKQPNRIGCCERLSVSSILAFMNGWPSAGTRMPFVVYRLKVK